MTRRNLAALAGVALASTCAASGSLTARPQPPSYAALAAGPGRVRALQGRTFRFTLGDGDNAPNRLPTITKLQMADPSPISYAIGEWGYSFHQLKNGQLDGAGQPHYGGYPTPPRTRAEAMEVVRRYYLRLREMAKAKATPEQRRCFIAINGHYCYLHYACEWGCDVVGSEVGENINSIQSHIAFTRGAARQYGKPWLMDFSPWYGPSIFDEDPRKTWGDNSGPMHGHSMSLILRTFYAAYMAGANIVVAEGGAINAFRSQTPGPDGLLPLSTLGVEAVRFNRFARRHPDRGIAYAPVALVLPVDHGIYPGFLPKTTWNAFPYQPGDQFILDALNALFPGSLGDPDQPERPDRQPGDPTWKDPEYMRTEALRLVASPHGDIADVLLANAPESVLRSYPVALLAGEFAPDAALARRLAAYVRQGGTLVVDPVARRSGLLASVAAIREPAAGKPYSRVALGKGAVISLAASRPGEPTASRPLSRVLAQLRRELVPIEVTGRVETLLNRTRDGWIVTIINNEGVRKKFREPVEVDPAAAQNVRVRWTGRGRVASATLWGQERDTPLAARDLKVNVPAGEVRIVRLTVR